MRVRELNHWPDDPSFRAAWTSLWQHQRWPLVFTHPTWVRIWWEHFGAGQRLALLVVERAGQLIGLAPLFEERSSWPLPRLRIVGYGTTNDYNDWLLPPEPSDREACLDTLFTYLADRAGWCALGINGVRFNSAIGPSLHRARQAGLLLRARPGLPCPTTTLTGNWPAYLESRGRTLRYHLRSRPKRLAEQGPLEYRRATASTVMEMLEAAIRLHALRWSEQRSDAVFSEGSQGPGFYRAVIPALAREGIADITSLEVGERAIASVVGFRLNGQYQYYIPAYDPEFASFVPGKLIVGHLMERAFDEGLETFDFMLGDEPYKDDWATERPRVVDVTLAPNRWESRALLGGERLARDIWSVARRFGLARQLRSALAAFLHPARA